MVCLSKRLPTKMEPFSSLNHARLPAQTSTHSWQLRALVSIELEGEKMILPLLTLPLKFLDAIVSSDMAQRANLRHHPPININIENNNSNLNNNLNNLLNKNPTSINMFTTQVRPWISF